MGCPGGHEHDPIYSLSIYARFSGQVFFAFSQKKIVMEKKDRCAVFGCNHNRLFPETNTLKFSFFARKAPVSTERVPPGHPIMPLNSNKFNMAAVSVKRCIASSVLKVLPLTRPNGPFYTTVLIVVTRKFCISIVFVFCWGYFKPQRN